MTALDLLPYPTGLPPRLAGPLVAVVRRQRMIAAATALVQISLVALLFLLAVSLLLGFVAFPAFVRLFIAGAMWGTVIYVAIRRAGPAFRQWTLSRAAQAVEVVHPDLQERLSSAVELTLDVSSAAFRGSPQLLAELLSQAQHQAGRIDPRTVVPIDRLFRRIFAIVPLSLAWVVLATHPSTSLALRRGLFHALMPWRSHLPANLANLVVLPGDTVVAEGDSIEIRGMSAARFGSPGSATLLRRYAGGQFLNQPMQRQSDGAFVLAAEDIRQEFSYQVRTDLADSDWYRLTVHPRPALRQLDLHYDFPVYTRMSPRDERSGEGEIRALAGTRVTMTFQTAAPIVLERSRLELSQGSQGLETAGLSEIGPSRYQAHFVVNRSGSYRIRLENSFGLENKDSSPHPIAAVFDQPPSVLITSPRSTVTVPPDDRVSVEYQGSDDFSIAALQAMVGVDDQPKRSIALSLPDGPQRRISGTWPLDIKAILAASGVKSASRIHYQIQATDNRDPDPQVGNSAEQVLIIDPAQSRSYTDQLNEERKRRLEDAIRKALERLRQADWRVSNLKNADDHHILNADERRDAGELRELLVSASGDLSAAAEEFLNTPYATIARAAKDIAENPIAGAAEDITKAQFAAEAPPQRQQSAAHAGVKIADAAKRLEKLLPASEQAQRQAEAAEALRQAAQKQLEAAEAMAEHAQDVDENRRTQQQAMNKLNDAMNKDPALRNDQARDLADRLADLTQKIEDDLARQAVLREANTHQQDAHRARDTAGDIAEAQSKLNQKIEQLSRDDQNLLKHASSSLPTTQERAHLIDSLKRGDLAAAENEMKQASARLGDAAKRMSDASSKAASPADQQPLAQASQNVQTLAAEQENLEKQAQAQSRQLTEARRGLPSDDQLLHQQQDLAAQTGSLRDAARQLADRGRPQRSATLARRAALAEKSLDEASRSQRSAADAQSHDQPEQAGGEQDKARDALAQANEALRGGSPPEASNGQPGKDGQDSAPSPNDLQSGNAPNDSPNNASAQQSDAAQQAAQAAQEAAAAQRQAMRPSPAAARQAANALARAQAAAKAAQNQRDSAQSSGDNRASQQAAQAGSESSPAQQASEKDGKSAGSRSGIRGESTGGNNTPPASVRDLGISAGDWARLPPLLQRDLLNAAQQSGPPAYREMIRNYYIRIATLESQKP